MKKKVQKALAISGLAIAIGASGLSLPASANAAGAKRVRHSSITRINKTRKIEHAAKSIKVKRIIPGIVKTISNNSLTMKSGDKTYTVNFDSSARLLNQKWSTITASDIKEGNKIRVTGTISDKTISAKKIRDLSI